MNDLGSVVVVVPHWRILFYGAKVVNWNEKQKQNEIFQIPEVLLRDFEFIKPLG